MYKYCKLQKNGITFSMWVPEQLAVYGKKVSIKTSGIWENHWAVVYVGTELAKPPFVIEC